MARPSRGDFDLSEDPEFQDELVADTVVASRYRILSLLGAGGMGMVYLAEHLEIGRRVAIKVLNSEWSGHHFVARRFRAEARIASAIGHPNIVEVFDAGQLPDGRFFLVMEHLDGHDLAQEIHDKGRLTPLRTAEVLRQATLGLAAAHNAGVIHRDLKPGNIMIATGSGGETIKVLDFGIACSPPATATAGHRLTRPGSVMGTPEYMAPEQSTGAEPTPCFDVYAVGVIAYEMLTGDPPLLSDHAIDLLALKRKQPAPSVATVLPDLHPKFVALIDDCLQISASDRPNDAFVVIERLDAFIDELADELDELHGHATNDADIATSTGSPRPSRSARASPPPPAARPPTPRMTPHPAPRPPLVLLGLSLGAVGLGAWLLLSIFSISDTDPRGLPTEPPSTAEVTPPPRPLGLELRSRPAVAPDAEIIVNTTSTGAEPEAIQNVVTTIESPKKTPTRPSQREFNTNECARIRQRADEARRAQAWSTLRDLSRRRNCWESDRDPRKLQTMALKELGDFAGCLTSGRGLKDPEVEKWLKLCQQRLR